MNNEYILIVTSELSRGLISLTRELEKRKLKLAVAAPRSGNEIYLMTEKFIRLPHLRIFGKTFLFKSSELKHFISNKNPIIHCVDGNAFKLNLPNQIYFEPSFGLDLKIWNPGSVSALRQTQFLTEYNIAPHQKLISVISPLGEGLSEILNALKQIDRDDFIIALTGRTGRTHKIMKQIVQSGVSDKIILAGQVSDMPTLLRASFANLSLTNHSDRMLKFAAAMGRPTIWNKSETEIKPNINLGNLSADAIARALSNALDMDFDKRSAAEKSNIAIAKKFSIENSVKECLDQYRQA